ncbi:MAG: chaperone NapD [Nitrospirae bacterium]|nr:chaperone NapD [Nitrospirota bacterium]
MAIAGAVVVPIKKEEEDRVIDKLNELDGVEVQQAGPKGIAVVLEADDPRTLKKISEKISKWEEVIEFELVYFNWEEC